MFPLCSLILHLESTGQSLTTNRIGEQSRRALGTFAVIDANGDGSYQAGQDFVIEIASPLVPIPLTTEFFA